MGIGFGFGIAYDGGFAVVLGLCYGALVFGRLLGFGYFLWFNWFGLA